SGWLLSTATKICHGCKKTIATETGRVKKNKGLPPLVFYAPALIASVGQQSAQVPQSVHISGSIV
ncbi:MAG: hypothetical protein LBB56_00820, partial [Chitinispirillales bacterium]|nr:hypothetical protein [Chitinispirillales bacterium]